MNSKTTDIDVIGFHAPIPGLGILPVNTFVIHGEQPVLVDTAIADMRHDFLARLSESIDPSDLRWIWITHADADHVGNLQAVLDAAPNARIVTTFIGMAKLGLQGFPVERCYLLNAGQELVIGDRKLLAVAPPVYDAPETTGLLDTRTGTLISADAFGALLPAAVESASEVDPSTLRAGMQTWAGVDAPWLQVADNAKFGASLERIRRLQPARILSSHLPPADGRMLDTLLANLVETPSHPPFIGPDQAALEAMMAAV